MGIFIHLVQRISESRNHLYKNKSPKGTNVCAMIGVKWYGGCLEVCQRPSNEKKLGAIFGDNTGIPK